MRQEGSWQRRRGGTSASWRACAGTPSLSRSLTLSLAPSLTLSHSLTLSLFFFSLSPLVKAKGGHERELEGMCRYALNPEPYTLNPQPSLSRSLTLSHSHTLFPTLSHSETRKPRDLNAREKRLEIADAAAKSLL